MNAYCLNCGALLGIGNVFCVNCGTPITARANHEQETVIKQKTAELSQQESKKSLTTVVIVCVAGVLALALAAAMFLRSTPPVGPTPAVKNTGLTAVNTERSNPSTLPTVESKPRPTNGCYLWSDGKGIQLHVNCETKNCNTDATTFDHSVGDGTAIVVPPSVPIAPGRRSYVWKVVTIDGYSYYAASNKIFCNEVETTISKPSLPVTQPPRTDRRIVNVDEEVSDKNWIRLNVPEGGATVSGRLEGSGGIRGEFNCYIMNDQQLTDYRNGRTDSTILNVERKVVIDVNTRLSEGIYYLVLKNPSPWTTRHVVGRITIIQ